MKKYFFIFFLFLSSLYKVGYSQYAKPNNSGSQSFASKVFPKKNKTTVASIVSKMALNGTVETEVVGYASVKSEQYALFNSLLNIATDKELINLFNHNNSAVQAYSFLGLVIRKNQIWKTILEDNISNKKPLIFQSGCEIGITTLGRWILEKAKYSMSEDEYKYFEQKL